MAIAEAAAPDLLERAHSWVANREVEGRAGRRAAVNPATGRPFAETTLLDAAQAGEAIEAARLVYAPLGVILAITPWNYPFSISLTNVPAALIAGNTVLLKPAPATTLVGLRIGALFQKAGVPEGVLGVLAVDDGLAASLVEDPRVAKIVFTGSVA